MLNNFKVFIILVKIFVNGANNLNVDNCGSGWISFSNIKCYKVLREKGSQIEATHKCSEISSTLTSIQTEEEQIFLSNLLYAYNNISDNIWIGLKLNNQTYEWTDGKGLIFENWGENADKSDLCVEMSLGKASLGKWRDDSCSHKYLIVCEKKQLSKAVLSQQVQNLTKIISSLQDQIDQQDRSFRIEDQIQDNYLNSLRSQLDDASISLEVQQDRIKTQQDIIDKQQNSINELDKLKIPIGFIYTQLPFQLSPKELWPQTNWTEVTQQYSGLFFRAEGEGSLPFEQIQLSNQSWISDIKIQGVNYNNWASSSYNRFNFSTSVNKQGDQWTTLNPTHLFDEMWIFMTSAEVRPKNTAIKIWKRIS